MIQAADFVIPLTVAGIFLFGTLKDVDIFKVFIQGALEGLSVIKNIFPVLIGLLAVLGMLSSSGAIDFICRLLSPVTHFLGVPDEVLPLALIRPISGSGSLAIFQHILSQNSPDSFIGRVASVMQGSSETTFYTIAVYFGAVGVTKTKYAIPAALTGDFMGMVISAFFVKLFFPQ